MNNEVFHASLVLISSLLIGAWLISDEHSGYGLTAMIFGFIFAGGLIAQDKKK